MRWTVISLVMAATASSFGQGLFPHLDSKQESAYLLVIPGVQKALNATKDQAATWTTLYKQHIEEQADFAKTIKPDASEADMTTAQKKLEDMDRTAAAALIAKANPEQVTRLRQIDLQELGLESFGKDDVVSELGISVDQKTKIDAIRTAWLKAWDDASEVLAQKVAAIPRPGDDTDSKKKYEDAMNGIVAGAKSDEKALNTRKAEDLARVVGLLTPDQQAKWKAMLGEPFDLKEIPGYIAVENKG